MLDRIKRIVTELHVLPIIGEINDTISENVLDALRIAEKEGFDLTLEIHSGGGLLSSTYEICQLIQLSPVHVIGFVKSHAQSAAATILQFCNYRIAIPSAEILFHNSLFPMNIDSLSSPYELQIDHILKSENENKRNFSQQIGFPLKDFKRLCLLDMNISSKQALDMGLIDEIMEIPQ